MLYHERCSWPYTARHLERFLVLNKRLFILSLTLVHVANAHVTLGHGRTRSVTHTHTNPRARTHAHAAWDDGYMG